MPGLVAFGRRWGVGGDDFVFPQLSEGFARFIWLQGLLAVFLVNKNRAKTTCAETSHLDTYITGLLMIYGVTIVLCFSTAFVSSRGSILNSAARRSLAPLLYARGAVLLAELGWNITGTVWVFGVGGNCDHSGLDIAAKVTLAVSCVLMLGFLFGLWMAFDPLGGTEHHKDVRISSQKAKRLWKNRLKLLLCCARGDDRAMDSFEDVAELLAKFFEDTDLVASDTWAGLLILVNDARPLSIRRAPMLEGTRPPSWMRADLAVRMMEFSLGVYGWPYYVWDGPCSPSRHYALLKSLHCCSCNQTLVMQDNCCHCNVAAFRLQTGLSSAELFHMSFQNSVMETPFVVAADTLTSTIVVTIRGTLSLSDAVTDICAADVSLRLADDAADEIRVHTGILAAARHVVATLDAGNILDDMAVLYPGFALTITGHSLGAGVAAVVAMLLRPSRPTVRCIAFSPPGCVVSKAAVPFTQSFILSVIVGDDLISRMSYDTMTQLKRDIMEAIELCSRPKYDILISGCYKLLCGTSTSRLSADVEAPPDPMPSGPVSGERMIGRVSSLEEPLIQTASEPRRISYTEEQDGCSDSFSPSGCEGAEVRVRTGLVDCARPECSLHLPGRILHITPKGGEFLPRSRTTQYQASWSDHTKFEQLKLSRFMMTDHMPHHVMKLMRSISSLPDEVPIS